MGLNIFRFFFSFSFSFCLSVRTRKLACLGRKKRRGEKRRGGKKRRKEKEKIQSEVVQSIHVRLTDYLTSPKSYSTVQYTLFGVSLLGKDRFGYWYSFRGSCLFPFSFSVAVVTGIERRPCKHHRYCIARLATLFLLLFLFLSAAALR